MKRRIILCALLLALALLLGACAQKPATETPPNPCAEVVAAIESSQEFEEMTALSANQILQYLDLNELLLVDQAMSMDASRATAEVIAVLTAVDEEALEQAKEALSVYRDVTLEQYRDYRPEEVPKLEAAVLKTRGLKTALVVSKDAAAAEKALDEAWK